ncbi:hypothetical protein [Chryseobacterium sp. T1]
MKKILLGFAFLGLVLQSCKKDNHDDEVYVEPTVDVQNQYDNEAATKFLDENYLDDKGNIKPFSDTDPSDDNKPKLSSLSPVKLPSGVIYILRPGAQPDPGTVIGETDIIRLMSNTTTYVATKESDIVRFRSILSFRNSISGTGVPDVDPKYYYISPTDKLITSATTEDAKKRSYYEIEGLREALQHFKSFNKEDGDNYNLQGIIIVPSRAAFARDAHYPYLQYTLRNRSFVFNFQVYKTTPRP